MNPTPHQQRIIDLNPKKIILNWEMRVGKSLPASIWIDNPQQSGNTYIICKKSNKQEWKSYNTKAKVITKEDFKKEIIINPTAIVVDEAHNFSAGLFVKGRSDLAQRLYKLVRQYPECRVMLLSGTPVRNSPWSLHTLLCYVGVYYDWKEWRDRFFVLQKMPYLRFAAYFPRKDWRAGLKSLVEKHTDIVSLKDVVDVLPPAVTRVIKVVGTKYIPPKDEIVTWTHEHRHEQKAKLAEILELGYKKIILVVYYTSEIDTLKKQLEEYKPVHVLDGRTKDQEATIREAQGAEENYFIVQAGCGEGWDGWMFGCMVFVSIPHSLVQFTQMSGRLRHPKHLKTTETIYLLGGRWDTKIYNSLMEGKSFNPHNYDTP